MKLNLAGMAIFRLRSMHDLSSFLDEYSALGIDKKTLLEMYKVATRDQFSFLYVNMLARSTDEMFFKRFEAKLIPGGREEIVGVKGNGASEGIGSRIGESRA